MKIFRVSSFFNCVVTFQFVILKVMAKSDAELVYQEITALKQIGGEETV